MAILQNGELQSITVDLTVRELGLLLAALDELPGKVGRKLATKIEFELKNQSELITRAQADARDAEETRRLEAAREEGRREASPSSVPRLPADRS